jgi:hypothetical protein
MLIYIYLVHKFQETYNIQANDVHFTWDKKQTWKIRTEVHFHTFIHKMLTNFKTFA